MTPYDPGVDTGRTHWDDEPHPDRTPDEDRTYDPRDEDDSR